MKTLPQLAEEALQVQDACNLSGVVIAFAQVVRDIGALGDRVGYGTVWRNQHPVVQLWASKVHDLSGMGLSNSDAYGRAYDTCRLLAASTVLCRKCWQPAEGVVGGVGGEVLCTKCGPGTRVPPV